MQVTNLAGGGGGVAYAEVVNKRNNDNNLHRGCLDGDVDASGPGRVSGQHDGPGALARHRSAPITASSPSPRIRPIKTLPELMDKIKADPASVAIAGGSAVGGWDHLKVLIAAKKAGIDDVRKIKYVAFDGGGEAVTQLLARFGSGVHGRRFRGQGLCRFRRHQGAGRAGAGAAFGRLLEVSDRQGTGHRCRRRQLARLLCARAACRMKPTSTGSTIGKVYDSAEWKKIMADNGLAPLNLRRATNSRNSSRARSKRSLRSPRKSG